MKKISHEQSRRNLARRRRRVAARHARAGHWGERPKPMFDARKVSYEIGGNVEATCFGGIAAVHRLVCGSGWPSGSTTTLELLKVHLPYHESDHVLNMAYNVSVWRHPAGRHRAAAARHRVHERAGRGADPGPDHGRGFLPPLHRGRRAGADGGDQLGPAAAVGRAGPPTCSARSPMSTPTAPSRRRTGSTRPGWTCPTRASGATRR